MAVHEFECLKCKAVFLLMDLEEEEVKNLICVECKSKKLNLIGFDLNNDQSVYILAKAIANLQEQVNVLKEKVEAYEDGCEE